MFDTTCNNRPEFFLWNLFRKLTRFSIPKQTKLITDGRASTNFGLLSTAFKEVLQEVSSTFSGCSPIYCCLSNILTWLRNFSPVPNGALEKETPQVYCRETKEVFHPCSLYLEQGEPKLNGKQQEKSKQWLKDKERESRDDVLDKVNKPQKSKQIDFLLKRNWKVRMKQPGLYKENK